MRILILLALIAPAGVVAKEQKIACPEEVPAHAVQVKESPSGWTGYVLEQFRLRSAAVTLGYVERRAVQLGEHQKMSGGRYKIVYAHLGMRKEEK